MEESEVPSPKFKLHLHRCQKCRCAFFSAQRREAHILSVHGIDRKTLPEFDVPESQATGVGALDQRQKQSQRLKLRTGRTEAVFTTLLNHWPPERATEMISRKHNLCLKKATNLVNRMLRKDYSASFHSQKNVRKILLAEHAKESVLNRQRLQDLSAMTGLSQKLIKYWFCWQKRKGRTSASSKIMHETFYRMPYPSDETLQALVFKTSLLLPKIRVWFRLSRARSGMMEFKELEEKLLWAWFLKNPDGVLDRSEVKEISDLVGMTCGDVEKIFGYWRTHWRCGGNLVQEDELEANLDALGLPGLDISSHSAVMSALQKARKNQQMLGIPVSCKIVGKVQQPAVNTTGNFSAYTSNGYVSGSFNRQSRDAGKTLLFKSSPEKIQSAIPEDEDLESGDDCSVSDEVCFGNRLEVRNHVLHPVGSAYSTDCAVNQPGESNLFTLFNPASLQVEEFGEEEVYSSENDVEGSIHSEGSSDEGNRTAEDTDASESEDDVLFVKEVFPVYDNTIIDLTVDSDASEGEQKPTQSTPGTEVCDQEYDEPDFCEDDGYESPALVIYESDSEEAGPIKNEPPSLDICHKKICLSSPSSNESELTSSSNITKDEKYSRPRLLVQNSFKKLQFGKRTLLCKPSPQVSVTTGTKKQRRRKQLLPLSKRLFSKSLKQCRMSPKMALKRKLHQRTMQCKHLSSNHTKKAFGNYVGSRTNVRYRDGGRVA